jgi:ATPase
MGATECERLRKVVPDTSVLIDGRVSAMVEQGDLKGAHIIVAEASLGELEHLANTGRGIGWKGLREMSKLREHFEAGRIKLEFHGQRPSDIEVAAAPGGAIDNLIRSAALEVGAELITSDRVQSEVARAKGVPVTFIEPEFTERVRFQQLRILRYFDDQTFSVHLKEGVPAYAKRGTIGQVKYLKIGDKALTRPELLDLASELLDFGSRDEESYIEMDRPDSRVLQLRNIRISIAYPPFSDGVEITAVRPTGKPKLEEYGLEAEVVKRLEDYHRGVIISGRPGDGKSTFAQAVAEHLARRGAVVKTMEQPRDMQVPPEITQYSALDGDMALTAEVLLLVRPDFVVYDEVRKTKDFEVFADMRLAGVGLIGVAHANRAIDSVQRLIGRVELGIIPQVVDTVIHLVAGQVEQVLDLEFTVKVPAGMFQEDLARPVISVRDFREKREVFEIYTYGDQVVVMPVGEKTRDRGVGRYPGDRGGPDAPQRIKAAIEDLGIEGEADIEMTGPRNATVYVQPNDVGLVVGHLGTQVKRLERELRVRLRVEGREPAQRAKPRGEEQRPRAKVTGKTITLFLGEERAGDTVDVVVDGKFLFEAEADNRGVIKISRRSAHGKQLAEAARQGLPIAVRTV